MHKLSILFLTVIGFIVSYAQDSKSLDYYKEQYPESVVVYAYKIREVSIALNEKNKIAIIENQKEARINLDSESILFPQESISFSSFDTINSVKAYVSEQGVLWSKKHKVEKFFIRDDFEERIFHNDIRSINFDFPSVEQGALAILEYERQVYEPRFLHSFYFAEFSPVDIARVKIDVPDNIKLGYKCMNCDSLDIQFKEEVSRGKRIYSWIAKQVPELKYEEDSPGLLHYLPHIIIYIDRVEGDNSQRLLSSEDELYQWYSDLLENMNNELSPDLKMLVDSLTVGEKSDLEKAKAMYYWIHKNIKYIAFEDGLGGFVPRDAQKVFERRYGDCKDMSNLLKNMLEYSGQSSYLAWIGTRELPYNVAITPVPQTSNHMILAYPTGDDYLFIDETSSYLPFGMPARSIQGKTAMIGLSPEKMELRTVPEVAAKQNVTSDSTFIFEFNKGSLKGRGYLTLMGYEKQDMDYVSNTFEPDILQKYLDDFLQKGNNSFEASSIDISEWNSNQKNTSVSYNFQIKDYWVEAGDKIFINPFLDKPLNGKRIDSSRTYALKSPYKGITNQIVVLKIPDNYKVKELPTNSVYNHELFGYDISFSQLVDNHMKMKMTLWINYLLLQPNEFDEWNDMIINLSKEYRNVITLEKIEKND